MTSFVRRSFIRVAASLLSVYWFVFRPKTNGVKCIIVRQSQILFVRNTYGSGQWTFPGGGMHQGENPSDAIKRELKEEISIIVDDLRYIGEIQSQAEYKRDTVHIFSGTTTQEKLQVNHTEISAAEWFHIDQLPTLSPIATKIYSYYSARTTPNS